MGLQKVAILMMVVGVVLGSPLDFKPAPETSVVGPDGQISKVEDVPEINFKPTTLHNHKDKFTDSVPLNVPHVHVQDDFEVNQEDDSVREKRHRYYGGYGYRRHYGGYGGYRGYGGYGYRRGYGGYGFYGR